ncbi:MAG: transglycosylase domain-containing protein [Lachnospiraceae bacterium]|nr:transglycosylase domain-containing protein [Lachnospiraceae bacterium]
MDFSKKGIIKKQHEVKSYSKRMVSKVRIMLFTLAMVSVVVIGIIGCMAVYGGVKGMIENAPDLSQINIDPEKFTTHIYYSDGSVSGTVVGVESNRILVTSEQVPKVVKDCFVALEDKRFYEHDGIDMQGILRAVVSGISSGDLLGFGGSTITQQLLKIRVFNYGNEPEAIDKITRKIQEQFLAIQLENYYTKDEILMAYMNNINLGNRSFGVQMAANNYFGKDVAELTLSEAAVIAAIALSPVRCNPINFPETNAERRQACLNTMLELGWCTQEEYDEAVNDEVYARIKNYAAENSTETYYSYFNDEVIRQVLEDLMDVAGYTAEQAEDLLYSGGLDIYTTQDKEIQEIVDAVYCDETNFPGLGNETGSFYELTPDYAVSILKPDETQEHYQLGHILNYYSDYDDSELHFYHENYKRNHKGISRYTTDPDKLNELIDAFIESVMEEGDSIAAEKGRIYTLQPQSSLVIMDQQTGRVVAIYGGRGEKEGSLTLNRATTTLRQVGSTFKVLASFLPALDTAGMTLATVADDSLYMYPGTETKVSNWNGEVYEGFTSIRRAIYHSMNVIACRIMEEVTPQVAFDYLKKLGFTTLVDSRTAENGKTYTDIGIPLALGGLTDGVTNLELTAAYATIANSGIYNPPVFYTKVVDHNGNIILSNDSAATQVIKTSTAYLLTDAMVDTTVLGTGYRLAFSASELTGYAETYALKKLNLTKEQAAESEEYKALVKDLKDRVYGMPIAGKTGTTHDYTDLWFAGYTPYYTASIWTGYDNNLSQIDKNYHQYIWRKIMEQIHIVKELDSVEFTMPDSIITATICTKCGNLAVSGLCDQMDTVRSEYFAKGTVPTEKCTCHVKVSICKESGQIASLYCPAEQIEEKVFLVKEETSETWDTPNILPTGEAASVCTLHTAETMLPENTPTPEPPIYPEDLPALPENGSLPPLPDTNTLPLLPEFSIH